MIRILTSSMGLGTYVPALFLKEYIEKAGRECEIQVIETYLKDEKVEKFLKNKKQYHQSFKVAQLGHKLAEKKLESLVDADEMNEIYIQWDSEITDAFIIFSGNWIDVLLKYQQLHSDSVYTVHMDVGVTPSWCRFTGMNFAHNFRVYDDAGVNYIIEYPEDFEKKSFEFSRTDTPWVYVHGGGWGMGTYQKRYHDLNSKLPYCVRTTVHNSGEADFFSNWEYYLLDEAWKPWSIGTDDQYPPIYRLYDGKTVKIPNQFHKGMYSLYQDCCAIISKAGGGTLMDSLITATPLVFIDPIAKHEEENQKLWIKLGFGITLEEWELQDYSLAVLKKMYENIILYRKKLPGLGHALITDIERAD